MVKNLLYKKLIFFIFKLEIDNCSNEYSVSNSPTRLTESEACRTIVSLLINQRKANLDLEQQLKHLQSSIKPISIDEHPTHSFSKQNKLFLFYFIVSF
jgi:hypothetical protein